MIKFGFWYGGRFCVAFWVEMESVVLGI